MNTKRSKFSINVIINEWDIHSNQSIYRKELAKIYVKHVREDFVNYKKEINWHMNYVYRTM